MKERAVYRNNGVGKNNLMCLAVLISGDNCAGTGFILRHDDSVFLVTCLHVMSKINAGSIIFNTFLEKIYYELKIEEIKTMKQIKNIDACIIKLSDDFIEMNLMCKNVDDLLTLDELSNELYVTREIILTGYPGLGMTNFQPMLIKSLITNSGIFDFESVDGDNNFPDAVFFYGDTSPGMSGSPVLIQDENKSRLVGVLSGPMLVNNILQVGVMYGNVFLTSPFNIFQILPREWVLDCINEINK